MCLGENNISGNFVAKNKYEKSCCIHMSLHTRRIMTYTYVNPCRRC